MSADEDVQGQNATQQRGAGGRRPTVWTLSLSPPSLTLLLSRSLPLLPSSQTQAVICALLQTARLRTNGGEKRRL